jgi:hypothetical protein
MTVETVQPMRGFVLNGMGVGGWVEKGHDTFLVKRKGKVVFEEKASIISQDSLQAFEANAGHEVEFYISAAADDAVAVGDVLEAEVTTCGKGENP